MRTLLRISAVLWVGCAGDASTGDSTDSTVPPQASPTRTGDTGTDSCGNGVIDEGETCDPPGTCPSACPTEDACQPLELRGNPANCTAECLPGEAVETCLDGDGCCPAGCSFLEDDDCVLDCTNDASWPQSWKDVEDEVLAALNEARTRGTACPSGPNPALGELTNHASLRQAARCHGLDMAINDYVSHVGFDGSSFLERAERAGYPGTATNENIAAGLRTANAAVDAWLGSAYCDHVMNEAATEVGAGYVAVPISSWEHHWAVTFGRR